MGGHGEHGENVGNAIRMVPYGVREVAEGANGVEGDCASVTVNGNGLCSWAEVTEECLVPHDVHGGAGVKEEPVGWKDGMVGVHGSKTSSPGEGVPDSKGYPPDRRGGATDVTELVGLKVPSREWPRASAILLRTRLVSIFRALSLATSSSMSFLHIHCCYFLCEML